MHLIIAILSPKLSQFTVAPVERYFYAGNHIQGSFSSLFKPVIMGERRHLSRSPRLGSLVEGYIRRSLNRGMHPAFDFLRDKEASVVVPLESGILEGSLNTELQVGATDRGKDKLYTDAFEERERFCQAMKDYEQTTVGTKF